MSFATCKDVIEENDTVIIFVNVAQIYAIEATHRLYLTHKLIFGYSPIACTKCRAYYDLLNWGYPVKPVIKNKHGQDVVNIFQTQYGSLKVIDLVGIKFGSKVNLSKGFAFALYPTPELWTLTLPHRTQILYTPDISMVIMQLEIGPGSVVCEAGTGSGSLSHAFLRCVGGKGRLITCDFHKERVEVALNEFSRHGFGDRVSATCRDVCQDGLGVEGVADAVFLDLPKPWDALPMAVLAIKNSGGRICCFSPCIEQVSKSSEVMSSLGLGEIVTLECLIREFQVKAMSTSIIDLQPRNSQMPKNEVQMEKKIKTVSNETVRDTEVETATVTHVMMPSVRDLQVKMALPSLKMPGHTGFLTFATVPPSLKRISVV